MTFTTCSLQTLHPNHYIHYIHSTPRYVCSGSPVSLFPLYFSLLHNETEVFHESLEVAWFILNKRQEQLNIFEIVWLRLIWLPKFAFLWSVHGSICRTVELLLEVFRVSKRSNHSESAGRMRIWQNLAEQRLWCLYLAPDLGVGDKQELLRGELRQSRQSRLRSLALHGPQVRSVGLADAAIVSNILALSIFTIQLKTRS